MGKVNYDLVFNELIKGVEIGLFSGFYHKEWITISMNGGRRSGKTTWVVNKVKEFVDDGYSVLVINPNAVINNSFNDMLDFKSESLHTTTKTLVTQSVIERFDIIILDEVDPKNIKNFYLPYCELILYVGGDY